MNMPAPVKIRISTAFCNAFTMQFDNIDVLKQHVDDFAADCKAEVQCNGSDYTFFNNGTKIAHWEKID